MNSFKRGLDPKPLLLRLQHDCDGSGQAFALGRSLRALPGNAVSKAFHAVFSKGPDEDVSGMRGASYVKDALWHR